MPSLTNPTADAVNMPEFGISLEAGGSVEVSEAVAGQFAGHPVLTVVADPAPVDALPDAVPAPVVVPVRPLTPLERAEADVARASAELQAAQAGSVNAAPAAITEESK